MANVGKNVAQMKPGETGVIEALADDFLSAKLLEMGCLPGATITYNFAAPLGDPICISVLGYELSLRVEEAASISIVS